MLPKVVEALLGTRFCGRGFLRAPLVSVHCLLLEYSARGQCSHSIRHAGSRQQEQPGP